MVIFFDIDGTLVDEKTQILPQSAANAVRALAARGHIPVVNTGRPYSHLDPRIRALPFAGWICAGGQEILLQDQWLKKETIPESWLPEVIRQVREHGLQVVYEADGGFYLDETHPYQHPEIRFQCDLIRRHGGYVRYLEEGIEHAFVKFCTFDAPGGRRMEFTAAVEDRFVCIQRRGMIELLVRGNSKAVGLQMVLEKLGCPLEQTMAFGDSANDLPMLQAVGTAVCMGGGAQEAKAAAHFVTRAVLDDGIEYALRHYGMIE